jgi:hypothetical protein
MDASVKNLTITGAAASLGDIAKPRRKRGISRKKPSEALEAEREGDDVMEEPVSPVKAIISKIMPPAAVQTPAGPHVRAMQTPVTAQVRAVQTTAAAQVRPQQSHSVGQSYSVGQSHSVVKAPVAAPPLLNAGTQKVNLIPPKSPRVKLNPKMIGGHTSGQSHTRPLQTRKARRVIVPNLSARFTRAKKLRDETEKSPIDTIRNYLIEKGVIQSKSKAPEKMLRSMYNDFNLLKDGQAL